MDLPTTITVCEGVLATLLVLFILWLGDRL